MCNKKWTLFDLLPVDILNVIDVWLVRLGHCKKLKDAVTLINSQQTPAQRVSTYHNWECLKNFGNLLCFKMIRNEDAGTHNVKSTYSWGATYALGQT